MANFRTLSFVSLIALVLFALTSCQAKDAAQQTSSSITSKLTPQTKTRSARSLSDMFEKMKSKIFGSRKQATATSQVQPAASVNAAQRQPWGDLNSFNQQYNPYSSLSSNYQWPSSSANQYLNQQYGPMSGFANSQVSGSSAYPGLSGAQSQSMMSGIDNQQQSQSALNPAVNSNNANSGLLSSASHLIAQYLSPTSALGSPSGQSSAQSSQQQLGQNQQNGQAQNLMTPQQQQQQTQYNEFASILDSMVAQTGASSQRQPNLQQYLGGSSAQLGQQGMPAQQGYQSASGNMMGSSSMSGDNEMSASNSIQSYMPAAVSQQANQKSSMVGLAEQLAPGAQFNKLVSFPFSLSNNDDPNKEGRYKLHIPFLNQHVKRSDQQVSSNPSAAQRQQQSQNSYQQYVSALANQAQAQHQLIAQSSQLAPSIVSPQSSLPLSQSPSGATGGANSLALPSSSQPASSSSSISQPPSSSAALSSQINSAAAAAVSVTGQQQNSRPTWSVADLQSNSSPSKLIPIPSAASSSLDSASSTQS